MKKYKHFSHEERQCIYEMYGRGFSLREIGRKLGRGENVAGSINRELRRNKHPFPLMEKAMSAVERAWYGQQQAKKRRQVPRKKEQLKTAEIRSKVIELLVNEQASPRDISSRLKEQALKISWRAIYYFTKHDRKELQQYLRLHGKPRRQRVVHRRSRFKEGLPAKKIINQRPWYIGHRIEFGHYEADTIHSCQGGSGYAILTIRELKSRKRFYCLMADLKAETTNAMLLGFFRMLPAHMRKSLTVDNGSEFEHLYKLEQMFAGFRVYYCHPYCAWERGSVENANGEFRWYYPKGIDFLNVPSLEIHATGAKINRRRMLCLDGKSAEQVFEHALNNPPPQLFYPSADEIRGYGSSNLIEKINPGANTELAFSVTPHSETNFSQESPIWVRANSLVGSFDYSPPVQFPSPVYTPAEVLHWIQSQADVFPLPVQWH